MEPGKLYFFTATILNWKPVLQNDHHKFIVINSLEFLSTQKKVSIYAFVIMPTHIHLIWCIHQSPSKVQQSFMKYTAQSILENMKRNNDSLLPALIVNAADRKYQVWQRNSLPIELYSDYVTWQKLDYIHNNPCVGKWRLAESPEEYRFSSASFYMCNKSEWNFLKHIMDA